MIPSAFTPPDLLELSNEEPRAERYYDAGVAILNGQDALTVGESRWEAFVFAEAIQIARAEKTCEEAALANLVDHVNGETLPVKEAEYGIVPEPGSDFAARKAEYERRVYRPLTWTRARITAALAALLGDDFIAYRPTTSAEAVVWPADPAAGPGNWIAPNATRKIIRLRAPISINLGSPQWVYYDLVSTPDNSAPGTLDLVVGDGIVVEAEILGQSERLTVTAGPEDTTLSGQPARRFQATPTKAHSAGALGFVAPWPRWTSSKRHSLVVVTPAAAADPSKRRLIDKYMRRMVRGTSTWDIAQSADGLTTGTFQIGVSLLGTQTIVSTTI